MSARDVIYITQWQLLAGHDIIISYEKKKKGQPSYSVGAQNNHGSVTIAQNRTFHGSLEREIREVHILLA